MSTLCSIDLAKSLPEWGFQVAPSALPALPADRPLVSLSCYTYGAPRTGNTTFAKDFNRHVPDCWGVSEAVGAGQPACMPAGLPAACCTAQPATPAPAVAPHCLPLTAHSHLLALRLR